MCKGRSSRSMRAAYFLFSKKREWINDLLHIRARAHRPTWSIPNRISLPYFFNLFLIQTSKKVPRLVIGPDMLQTKPSELSKGSPRFWGPKLSIRFATRPFTNLVWMFQGWPPWECHMPFEVSIGHTINMRELRNTSKSRNIISRQQCYNKTLKKIL